MIQVATTKTTNSSGILTSAGTALAANPARMSYHIQNLGTNPLFVREGSGASTTNFDYILAGGSGADDGSGGSYDSPAGQTYTGIITFAGTAPRCVASDREQE